MSTQSTYSDRGLTVSIDWQVTDTTASLVADVTFENNEYNSGSYTRRDKLTEFETRYIVSQAKDASEYARIYWRMIL